VRCGKVEAALIFKRPQPSAGLPTRNAMNARQAYPHFQTITTRWKDNDIYGHVNNVEYYSYFDTVINAWLIRQGGLSIHDGPVIGVCAESHCRFLDSLGFPDAVDAGLRVAKLGHSSVRYEIGLFREGSGQPAAEGWFVHVFVDRAQRRPTAIAGALREALERLVVPGAMP
jgi:acyl-CoA thioester hydrolase